MISWKNPEVADRELTMDDYLTQGVLAALDAVNAVVPKRKVHATAIASVAPARDRLSTAPGAGGPLASMTLSRHDRFRSPESSVSSSARAGRHARGTDWKHGVLDSKQWRGLQLLRTYDLLWSPRSRPTSRANAPVSRPDGLECRRHRWRGACTPTTCGSVSQHDLAERRYVASATSSTSRKSLCRLRSRHRGQTTSHPGAPLKVGG